MTKTTKTGLTADGVREIRRLSAAGSATVLLGDREFFAASPDDWTIREIVETEIVREDPEWRWAAHAIHCSESILTVRTIADLHGDRPAYLDGRAYYARVRRNTRWQGETPTDRILGPYASRDEALGVLEGTD